MEVNKPTANEENARYMANPKKGFWSSIRKAFGDSPRWLNNKGEAVTVVLIVAGVVVLAAVGFLGMAWHGICQLGGN